MLYAIVSDIHSNLPAWKAVLADLTAMKAEKIICLGDVLGYGPEPAETLESVYRHIDAFVMGNHDAVIAGKMTSDCFNDYAREMIEWTGSRISKKGRLFLARQPLIIKGPDFICVHGSPHEPAAFNYITSEEDAAAAYNATTSPLIFVGHTHIPGIIVLGASGQPHILASQDFEIEQGKRYIVNTGSIGDPRDGDMRASYCLYDDVQKSIIFRRVAFDYSHLKEAAVRVGLNPDNLMMLNHDRVKSRTPIRESLGFSPAGKPRMMAKGVISEATLDNLTKTNNKLKHTISGLIIFIMAISGAFTGISLRNAKENEITIPKAELSFVKAYRAADLEKNLLPVIPYSADGHLPNTEIKSWRYTLENPNEQEVSLGIDPASDSPTIVIKNKKRHSFRIEAPEWYHEGYADDYRITVEADAMIDKSFSGNAVMIAIANYNSNHENRLVHAELNLKNTGTLERRRRTTEKKDKSKRLNLENKRVTFMIKGDFEGTLIIANPKMTITK